jgi:hypothetical protein
MVPPENLPHLSSEHTTNVMVLYWCGVGCLLLETERSPLQPRGYGTNFQAG